MGADHQVEFHDQVSVTESPSLMSVLSLKSMYADISKVLAVQVYASSNARDRVIQAIGAWDKIIHPTLQDAKYVRLGMTKTLIRFAASGLHSVVARSIPSSISRTFSTSLSYSRFFGT